ncbi:MAG: tetratricopeptide repeat protein [bacterium]|nr:tetratricopeptide repeat protein [bacterium]
MNEEQIYRRLLSFATGFKDRFALLLIKISHFHVGRRWEERLAKDLAQRDIRIVTIDGAELPSDERDITSFLRNRVPAEGCWILSFSHFESHMFPVFPERAAGEDNLTRPWKPRSEPPPFLQRLNVERDALIEAFPVPMIFWALPAALRQIAEFAPDFYDFRRFILDLPEPEELRNLADIPRAAVGRIPIAEQLPKAEIERLNAEIDALRSKERTSPEGSRLIRIMSKLAATHGGDGGLQQGLVELQEALAEAKRFALIGDQARLEVRIALFLAELARWEEALSRLQEAVSLFRRIAQSDKSYLPELVTALKLQGEALTSLGRRGEAREIYEEALDLCREVAERDPQLRSPLLAEVLNNLALLLADLGQREKADALYREAIAIYRKLPHKRYLASLALTLNNFGNLMVDTNRLDVALPTHEEALHFRRLLFASNPERYRADLSQSLYNLSLLRGEIGDYRRSKELFDEALEKISYLPGGRIEFLGCGDHQVKVGGYRIELGEIEAALRQYHHVREVVAVLRKDTPGESRLVAYYVTKEDRNPSGEDLRSFLRERLPEYMVPLAFVKIETLPLRPNGKIDYQALPSPDSVREGREAAGPAPQTHEEKVLAGIWSDVFGVETIGTHNNFFDLGGDSMTALAVLSRIRQDLQVELSAISVFELPILSDLARAIEQVRERRDIPGTISHVWV